MIEIALKAIFSGLVVAGVLTSAKLGRADVAGVLVLTPIVTVLGYYFIGQEHGSTYLREVVRFSLLTFPTWIVFAGAAYVSLRYFDYVPALVIASACWLVAATTAIALLRS